MPFIGIRMFDKKSHKSFILCGDIGGTNANLGIVVVKNRLPKLLSSFRFKSQQLGGLHFAINDALSFAEKNHSIEITKACFAVAGVLSANKDYAKMTNVRWGISKKELLEKTKLKKILLINDFEAIGYGINLLAKKDFAAIKKAPKMPKAPIIVVGAGTGLGKATLVFDEACKSYIPIPSEAGHSDFAAQNQQELDLVNFIKRIKKIKSNVPYEFALSGQGLINIYLFLRKSRKFNETEYTKEIDKAENKPELISRYRKIDKTCKAAFDIFKIAYARFARNFALDALAYGGVYIAGGIAPKNKDIFDRNFIKAFEDNYKLHHVLKKIPIYLITNTDIGLIGAGFVGAKRL